MIISGTLQYTVDLARTEGACISRASARSVWLGAGHQYAALGGWSTRHRLFRVYLITLKLTQLQDEERVSIRLDHTDTWRFFVGILVPVSFLGIVIRALFIAVTRQSSIVLWLLLVLSIVLLTAFLCFAIKLLNSYALERMQLKRILNIISASNIRDRGD